MSNTIFVSENIIIIYDESKYNKCEVCDSKCDYYVLLQVKKVGHVLICSNCMNESNGKFIDLKNQNDYIDLTTFGFNNI